MNKLISLLYLSLFTLTCYSQNIQVIEAKDFENSDFEICIPCSEFNDVQIVALGESTHRGANTNIAKTKMVKYLHQKCGFNVLAFEACMYRMFENDKNLINGFYTGDSLRGKVSGAWSSTEMKELYDYVAETQKTQKRLAFTGFDNLIPQPAHKNFTKDFKIFIDSLNKVTSREILLDDMFYEVFNRAINKSYGFSKFPPQDTLMLHNTYRYIQNEISDNNAVNGKYFTFWSQMIDNLKAIYRSNYGNLRDLQMYNNLELLMNEYYPNEKIIIWGATAHFMKDSKFVDTKWHQKNKYMGDFINQKYGKKYYVMAFTALEGQAGVKGYLGLGKQKVVTKKGSIERYIDKVSNQSEYAFMSLNDPLNRKIISDEITSSSIHGTHPTKTNLIKVVDGIFYLRKEDIVNWTF